MKRLTSSLIFAGATLALAAGVFAAADVGQPAPAFSLTDTLGQTHHLADYAGKLVVLEWTNDGCPFVQHQYRSGKMQELQRTYTGKDVVWLSICSSGPGEQGNHAATDWEAIRQRQHHASTALLLDEAGTVGRLYGAKTTPHMFVIDQKGVVVYAGAIDNMPSTDPADAQKAQNYVAGALDATMTGQPVQPAVTRPYGCGVKYAPQNRDT